MNWVSRHARAVFVLLNRPSALPAICLGNQSWALLDNAGCDHGILHDSSINDYDTAGLEELLAPSVLERCAPPMQPMLERASRSRHCVANKSEKGIAWMRVANAWSRAAATNMMPCRAARRHAPLDAVTPRNLCADTPNLRSPKMSLPARHSATVDYNFSDVCVTDICAAVRCLLVD